MLYGIVSGHPRYVRRGIRVEDSTRVSLDPARLFDYVVNGCHSWCPPDLHVSCGAPGAPLSREVGARAAGTRDAPGAPLRREVGAGTAGTRGAPRAALSREVAVGAMGTHGAPRAALRREADAGAQATRDGLGAALIREAGV
jgi:hypothetical protein